VVRNGGGVKRKGGVEDGARGGRKEGSGEKGRE